MSPGRIKYQSVLAICFIRFVLCGKSLMLLLWKFSTFLRWLFELALHQYGLFWLKDDKRNVRWTPYNICNNICKVKVCTSRLSHLDSQLSTDFSYSEVNVMGQWWKKEKASIICDFLTKLQNAVLSLVTQIATCAPHSGMPPSLSRTFQEDAWNKVSFSLSFTFLKI